MIQLNFEDNRTFRWFESKRQFQSRFWEELQTQIRGQVKQMIQDLVQAEFNTLIGAQPYERIGARKNKRNGSYLRALETPVGRIQDIRIPRARSLDIRFSLFDRWQQVDEQVVESMLQTYLLSRSSSCAQKIIQSFGHSRFSRGFLQRLTQKFEENFQTWLNRPITHPWSFVFIDGMVVDVREVDLKQYCVLWALGLDEDLNTEVLGFLVLKTESQEGCERLLRDLKSRGLKPPKLIISDDSKAIHNAAAMVFPHTPQQGCIFHKIKATGRYLHHRKHQKSFLREAAQLYHQAKSKKDFIQSLYQFRRRWKHKEPDALRSFLSGLERTLTFFDFSKNLWTHLWTNNRLESFIGRTRSWTNRFPYFQGRGNLQIALFTYLCYQNRELVPNLNIQKDTILVA